MNYDVFWTDRGVHFTLDGPFSFKDLTTVNEVWQHFDRLSYQLWDLQDATLVDASYNSAALIAAIDGAASQSQPRMKVGFVIDDPNLLDFTEVYIEEFKSRQTLGTDWTFKIFKTAEEMWAWADPDYPGPFRYPNKDKDKD